jgi:hypothetical protein
VLTIPLCGKRLWKTPTELKDLVISIAPGRQLSYCGYEFEVPWNDVDEQKTRLVGSLINRHSFWKSDHAFESPAKEAREWNFGRRPEAGHAYRVGDQMDDLFANNGRLEFTFLSRMDNVGISQPEINRVIQSVRLAPQQGSNVDH